jgi:Zn-dependent peptidase ImmA (M78 family)
MSDDDALAELDRHVASLRRQAGTAAPRRADLKAVARRLGVDIHVRPSLSEGKLTLRGGRAVIEIDPGMGESRRAFTLAHELGHAYLLHPHREMPGPICRRWPSSEAFCNDFAASLLLPSECLEEWAGGRSPSLDHLRHVAGQSGASLSVASVRLLRTGMWSSLLLIWHSDGAGWSLNHPGGVTVSFANQLTDALNSRRHLVEESRHLCLRQDRRDELTIRLEVQIRRRTLLALVPLEPYRRGWRPRWLRAGRRQ